MEQKHLNSIMKSDFFSGIESNEIEEVLKCLEMEIKSVEKKEIIIQENDIFDSFGIVLEGKVEIVKENYGGKKVVIANLSEGNIFGEIAAFAKKKYWPSTVISKTDSKIMFLNACKVLDICKEACHFHKVIISNIINVISQKALMLNRKVDYLLISSIRKKICKYIMEQYKINKSLTFSLDLNREEMAFFLNVSRPSLSRELSKLRDENIIDYYKETIKIINLKKLLEE